MTNAEPIDEATGAVDPGMVRAGAAAAARRRELDISQRSLAADGIINAGALIAFEKGRSWPRERTRAKLEEVLRWPPGTIARLRDGQVRHPARRPPTPPRRSSPPGRGPARRPGRCDGGAHAGLGRGRAAAGRRSPVHTPGVGHPRGPAAIGGGRGARGTDQQGDPGVDQGVELGSRSYRRPHDARRHGAERHLGPAALRRAATRQPHDRRETAQAAGVTEADIVRAEAEDPVPGSAVSAIEPDRTARLRYRMHRPAGRPAEIAPPG